MVCQRLIGPGPNAVRSLREWVDKQPARRPIQPAAPFRFSPARRSARASISSLSVLLLSAVCSASSIAGAAETAPLPAEQASYRVEVVVSFGKEAVTQAAIRRELIALLNEAITRSVGPMWNCRVAEETGGSPAAIDALERTPASALMQRFPAADLDKVYLLAVDGSAAGYRLAGREWDAVTRDLSRSVTRRAVEARELPQAALHMLHELFRPLVVVDQTRWGGLVCRAKAGELVDQEGDWRPFVEGRMFEPYFRYLSPERTVERVQRVPWTWLLPANPERATAECRVVTGLRSPLSGRRRRVEVVALGIRRQADSTLLQLRSYPPASKPLAGVELEFVIDEKAAPLRFVSDRAGTVRLPGTLDAEAPYFWLNARSGQAWLARVPFVPGCRSDDTLELPDDTPRLRAEGEIALLQADLVDTVARRAVLAATARARAKDRRFKDMDEAINEVRTLPRAEKFAAELNTIRVRYVREAREAKDRAAEARIVKLCDETADLIKHYLDEDKIRAVREELDELRRIATEDEAARKQFEAQEARKKR